MYGSVAELMANQPDFNEMRIRGGASPYREPVMPGEQRLMPSMQDKLQPALPPVRKAANDFLEDYLTTRGGEGESVVADNSDFSAETRDAIRALLDQQRESLMREPMVEARPRMLEARPMTAELEIDPRTGGMRSRNMSSPFGYGPLPSAPVYREPANKEPFSDATPEFRDTLRRLGVIQ
jgi:hypothetical protein